MKGTKEITLTSRDRGVLTTINALRDELRIATTPKKALDIAARAAREKRIFEAIGASIEKCNEWAEVYLCAYWKFGDLVKDNPQGRPTKLSIDTKFSGSHTQRQYARGLRAAVTESQIPEYVKTATDRLEPASIAGCLEWIDPDLDERKAEARRQARLAAIELAARGNSPLAAAIRYPVIYADPPWQYEHVKTESRAIENQYPTMALEDICALPLDTVTTDDALLFLWATSPKLAEALQVLEAWGFTYRTSMVWVKDQIGMGYYARQRHELLLIATKGEPPVPAPADRPDSVVTAPRGAHSAKPEIVYALIERMYPTLPRLELFARQAREGWDRWGNQAA